ncbi:pyrroloquinoline quinone biosynthesis protein PqqB [Micromonospora sp. H33]|uniref:pyrroloquinoline quinone biosynthesis protein PqqB n=1 Tax=Micromonospora sp. H33 TaxID=3452215 RepID=UPI003F8B1D18
MRVRVLGTAAGGGWPQWNCACDQCGHARAHGLTRTQDCVAVSGDGSSWYLLNASPDLRTQLLAAAELAPGPGRRETPLRGVLLTDAELDHVLGLFLLREAAKLDVYATSTVLRALDTALPVRRIADPYGQGWRWHAVDGPFELDGGLIVHPFSLGAKKPRYAEDGDGSEWVAGYRIGDVVYAPCFGEWTEALDAALVGARVALIDGTFLTPDEMPAVPGHLSVVDSLPHLARHPSVRFLYTHLNNTNPLLSASRGIPLAAEIESL